MVRTGRGLAPRSAAFTAESPPRKRAGKRKMRSSSLRSQSSYLPLVESFKISQVKHLQGLLVPQTGRFPARQSRRAAARATFMDDKHSNVLRRDGIPILSDLNG